MAIRWQVTDNMQIGEEFQNELMVIDDSNMRLELFKTKIQDIYKAFT